MPPNTEPIFGLTPHLGEVQFVNADGTTAKDLLTAGASGSKVMRISAHSDDTAAVNLMLYVWRGGAAFKVGAVRVAIGAGNDGAVAAGSLLNVGLLPWLDGDSEFVLPAAYKLQVAPLVAVTAAKMVTVVCFAMDY